MAPFRFPRFRGNSSKNSLFKRRGFRNGFAAAAWVLVTIAAVTIGVLVSGASKAPDGLRPLNAAEVAQSLANRNNRTAVEATQSSTPALPPEGNTTAPSPLPSTPIPAVSVLRSSGGTIVASCIAGVAQILSSTAAQGFSIDDDAKPDAPKVSFESDALKLDVAVVCTGEVPQLQENPRPKSSHQDPASDS